MSWDIFVRIIKHEKFYKAKLQTGLHILGAFSLSQPMFAARQLQNKKGTIARALK
jgi:hypothetical protein